MDVDLRFLIQFESCVILCAYCESPIETFHHVQETTDPIWCHGRATTYHDLWITNTEPSIACACAHCHLSCICLLYCHLPTRLFIKNILNPQAGLSSGSPRELLLALIRHAARMLGDITGLEALALNTSTFDQSHNTSTESDQNIPSSVSRELDYWEKLVFSFDHDMDIQASLLL